MNLGPQPRISKQVMLEKIKALKAELREAHVEIGKLHMRLDAQSKALRALQTGRE